LDFLAGYSRLGKPGLALRSFLLSLEKSLTSKNERLAGSLVCSLNHLISILKALSSVVDGAQTLV